MSERTAALRPSALPGGTGVLRRLNRFADLRVLSMVLVFVVLCAAFHIASNGIFFTPRNLSLLMRQASIVAVVAAGVSTLMVMGEIDLSIGSAVYLCSVVAATLQANLGVGTWPTVIVTALAGVAMGAWQGLWVVRVAVPSFVVTLAGLLAFRGIGYYATDAATIGPLSKSFTALSEGFVPPAPSVATLAVLFVVGAAYMAWQHARLAREGVRAAPMVLAGRVLALAAALGLLAWAFGGFRGIPDAVLWVIGTGLVLWVLMTRTKFGRNAYMIGSNREASLLAGVPLGGQLFAGFVLMGLLYGIAGVLIAARLSASTPSAGSYMELDAIASAVIGGTSLRGGVGTIPGAIMGAVLLATIDNGMSILDVSSFIQLIVKGLVLLFALAFDAYMIRHRTYRI